MIDHLLRALVEDGPARASILSEILHTEYDRSCGWRRSLDTLCSGRKDGLRVGGRHSRNGTRGAPSGPESGAVCFRGVHYSYNLIQIKRDATSNLDLFLMSLGMNIV